MVHTSADDFARTVTEHLDWAREVIYDEIAGSDQLRLMAELEAVEARASDPSLYVAVFGEFSSGKSTLLNALLGEPLLPSSSMVTTSVPTVLRPAQTSWLRVRREGSGAWLALDDQAFRTWYREAVGGELPAELPAVVKGMLTTENAALGLAEIEIGVPAPVLGEHVVVIDTPGFNATETRHRDMALAAARRTDLAVVVVPATAPVSMSLGDFLTEELADQLDRCVFLLSKGRLFDADEQQDLVRWTAKRLADLGITDPVVLEAPSADEALNALATGNRDDPAVARMAELGESLAGIAQEHHRPAVEGSIRRLLSHLMTSLRASASAEREQLRRTQQELESMAVTDLERFLNTWSGTTKKMVRRSVRDVPDPLPLKQDEVRTLVAERIEKATAAGELKTLAGELPGIVDERFRPGAEELLHRQAGVGRDVLAAAVAGLAADFAREYSRLAALAGRKPPPVKPRTDKLTLRSRTLDLDKSFEGAAASSAKLVSQENWATGTGIGVGAVIGTILLPGVGTVVGGILGGLFGGLNDTKRARFKAEVDKAVGQAEQEVAAVVQKDLLAIVRMASKEVDRVVAQYTETFAADVADLLAEEARRRAQTAERIDVATVVIEETSRRRAVLVGGPR